MTDNQDLPFRKGDIVRCLVSCHDWLKVGAVYEVCEVNRPYFKFSGLPGDFWVGGSDKMFKFELVYRPLVPTLEEVISTWIFRHLSNEVEFDTEGLARAIKESGCVVNG